MYGWAGKILKADLSTQDIWEEPTPEPQKYIGGRGLGAKLFVEMGGLFRGGVPEDEDPFDARNVITFAPGPLTGTMAPSSGRTAVTALAPQSYPVNFSRSNFGGHFGTELKFAGFDAIAIRGKAEKPCYIWIKEEDYGIANASNLWGKDSFETQHLIKGEVDDLNAQVLTIGQAGEHLYRAATLQTDTGSAGGKAGFGAVMGSKNLKGIVVRGNYGSVETADPVNVLEEGRYASRLIFRPEAPWMSVLHDLDKLYTMMYKELGEAYKGFLSCRSCPAGCRTWYEIPELPGMQVQCVDLWYLMYQLLSGAPMDGKAVLLATNLSNRYGMNSHELLVKTAWLVDCLKDGTLKPNQVEGFSLPTFAKGTANQWEFIRSYMNAMAYRGGFGNVLADGLRRAAIYAEKNMGVEGVIAKSLEYVNPRGYMTMLSFSVGTDLHAALSSRDMDRCSGVWGTSVDYTAAERAFGDRSLGDPYNYETGHRLAILLDNWGATNADIGLCDWIWPILRSGYTKDLAGDIPVRSRLYNAVTGSNFSEEELCRAAGERTMNMERVIYVLQGRRREDDTIYEEFFKKPAHMMGLAGGFGPYDKEKWETMKDRYYRERGWDPATGIPTQSKLKELGLDEFAKLLVDAGLGRW